jgi:hypothetical protein
VTDADAAPGGEGAPDRAQEGLAHLQAAARELIAASRAFLDVVEDLVDDPGSGEAVLDALGDLSRRFTPRPSAGDDPGGVEHITID